MNRIFPHIASLILWSFAAVAQAEGTDMTHPDDVSPTSNTSMDTTDQGVLPLEDLRVFTRAYQHIRASYINEVDDPKLLEYAIRGMLNELDPHSSYLDASSFENLQVHTTGEFGGLGIEVSGEDGYVRVVSPIDDTPASKAGIEAGDLIIKIDNISIKGLSLSESVDKMRGPRGSSVVLTIVRQGTDQPFDLTLTRDVIQVKSARAEVLSDHFAYLRVAQFQANTPLQAKQALEKILSENSDIKGLVLDLRNNPGGVLMSSVELVDLFLDGGLVVYTEGRLENAQSKYPAKAGDMLNGLPIVVLINEGSASASEIVAGALQDHRRGVIVGTRSFGKGSVQTVIPITDEKAIKLTTALYYTPNGRSIQAQGITPDIIVERAQVTTLEKRARISEAELAGHLKNGEGGEDVDGRAREQERIANQEKRQSSDNQLYEAINLLKGWHLLSHLKEPPRSTEAPAQ